MFYYAGLTSTTDVYVDSSVNYNFCFFKF